MEKYNEAQIEEVNRFRKEMKRVLVIAGAVTALAIAGTIWLRTRPESTDILDSLVEE